MNVLHSAHPIVWLAACAFATAAAAAPAGPAATDQQPRTERNAGPGYQGGGPGMMGGYGRNPYGNVRGMMDGCPQGYHGMGPGVAGRHWSLHHGRGIGMMGGYDSGYFGMGPGMMGGYGSPGGAAPGMAGRDSLAPFHYLDLSGEQREKLDRIADDLRRKNWAVMGRLQDERARLRDLYRSEKRDRPAISGTYQQMGELRQQMVENRLDAYDKAEALLAPEQRSELRSAQRGYR